MCVVDPFSTSNQINPYCRYFATSIELITVVLPPFFGMIFRRAAPPLPCKFTEPCTLLRCKKRSMYLLLALSYSFSNNYAAILARSCIKFRVTGSRKSRENETNDTTRASIPGSRA